MQVLQEGLDPRVTQNIFLAVHLFILNLKLSIDVVSQARHRTTAGFVFQSVRYARDKSSLASDLLAVGSYKSRLQADFKEMLQALMIRYGIKKMDFLREASSSKLEPLGVSSLIPSEDELCKTGAEQSTPKTDGEQVGSLLRFTVRFLQSLGPRLTSPAEVIDVTYDGIRRGTIRYLWWSSRHCHSHREEGHCFGGSENAMRTPIEIRTLFSSPLSSAVSQFLYVGGICP